MIRLDDQSPPAKIRRLKMLIIFCIIAAPAFFYGDYSKEKYKSKDDLAFISGPFQSYEWTHAGKYSTFTFRLKNYNDLFSIGSEDRKFVDIEQFKKIPVGEILSISIHPSNQQYLNTEHYPIFVYTISSNKRIYLTVEDTVKIYNRNYLQMFSIVLLVFAGLAFGNYLRLSKIYRVN